jgi:hypothetical protein
MAITMHYGQPDGTIETREITGEEEQLLLDEKAEYALLQYKWDRSYAYQEKFGHNLADQLDFIYHNGLDAWKDEIKKIKDTHPKPE